MSINLVSPATPAIRWTDVVKYPAVGSARVYVLEDANCKYALVSVVGDSEISEHTSPRNATVNVIEGSGTLTIEDSEVPLAAGVFAFVPANKRHAITAATNLSFLLTLSEAVVSG